MTLTTPSPLHNSHTSWLDELMRSDSTCPLLSFALPTRARRPGLPETWMAATTAVITPSGARQKRRLSRSDIDSLKNCLVTCSPKRVRIGASSMPILLVKSSQSLGTAQAIPLHVLWVSGTPATIRESRGGSMRTRKRDEQSPHHSGCSRRTNLRAHEVIRWI